MTSLPRAVAEARITCSASPWQAEGRLWDGPRFYMRVRSNRATLGLGATHHDAVLDSLEGSAVIDAPFSPTDAEAWALFDLLLPSAEGR